jgi:Ran GTPase-activating protein (RanGAP) involved in mRNA processing and transport
MLQRLPCSCADTLDKSVAPAMQVFALCETLRDDISVVALDLSNNFLDNMAAQAIAGLIKVSQRHLHTQTRGRAGRSPTSREVHRCSCVHVCAWCMVRRLSLLVSTLHQANRTLRFINLAGNDIGPEGAKHLASALSAPDCALQV